MKLLPALGFLSIAFISDFAVAAPQEKPAEWALVLFKRPANAKPIISPNPDTRFDCPIRKESIAWEACHTFNPAATILNGRICVLYRAEDNIGAGGIGGYTSRSGMAISCNGLEFTREAKPVFYPAEDSQKPFE